jgi:hypothetical protein
MSQYKYILEEKDLPTQWYNILSDMENPPPPYRHPVTLEPQLDPPMPPPLFPMALIEQEFSQERWIEIPEEVQDIPRQSLGEGSGYPGQNLLQVGGRQPTGQPQTQHRRGPGLLC